MRILLLSLNYDPEMIGIGLYSGELAKSLAAKGHQVEVVCAPPFYPGWRVFDGYRGFRWSKQIEAGVTVHRCPVFVPARVTGFRRVLHYLSFAVSSFFPLIRTSRRMRPDIIIAVAPSLLAAPGALITAKLGRGKSWLHVQDFEVEAGFATGQMQKAGNLARLALWFERQCIRRFDRTSSISPEMCRKLAEKGSSAPPYELRNWADLDAIKPQPHSAYRESWRIPDGHVALYSGALARKQGLETIVEAARLLIDRGDLTFVICGQGPMREKLESLGRDLPNIMFRDLQPADKLGELLALATVHLLPQKAGVEGAVLPSKLTNMLASGRPIIATANANSGLAEEVEGCGLVIEPENAPAMASAILHLLGNATLREKYSIASRLQAKKAWAQKPIIDGFVLALEEMV